MLQIVEFNEQLKDDIILLENECVNICHKLQAMYVDEFQKLGVKIMVECMRTVKGKVTNCKNVFDDHYESFVEIGIEEDDEYFPNAYIPIWRCKKEMFQEIGYLTKYEPSGMEKKIHYIIQEMLHERLEEIE